MKKKTFHLIDVILVFVLLLVLAAAIYRALSIKQLPDTVKDQKIEYTLALEEMDTVYGDLIEIGDKLYLTDKGIYCGEVVAVQKSFAHRDVTTGSQIRSHVYPAACKLTLKVRLSADISEHGFYVGENTYLNLGKGFDLYTEKLAFRGLLTAIERKDT